MSDKDKQKQDDIISSAEDAPETIGDEQLNDVDGGWTLKNVQITSYSTSGPSLSKQPLMATVYGGSGNDDILDAKTLLTRKGMPDPYSGM